jgi:hypothetical protein
MTIYHSGLRAVGSPLSPQTFGLLAVWTVILGVSATAAQAESIPTATNNFIASANLVAAADRAAITQDLLPATIPAADLVEPGSLQAFLGDWGVTTGSGARRLLEAEAVDQPAATAPIAAPTQPEAGVGSLADSGADALRQKLLIKPLAVGRQVSYAPGSTAGGPTAFGADYGDAYSGLSLSNRRPTSDTADAAFSTGFGLGDARRTVGLEVNVSSGSITKFGSNGDVGLKLHRNLPGNAAVAIGWDSGITWGNANKDTVSTVYGVATKAFMLNPESSVNKMPLTVSLGIGGGRFRSYDALDAGRNTLGVFGSLGLQVAPQASLVSTWTGRDLNLGMSFVPVKNMPIFVTAAAANVLRNHDNNTLFTLSVGVGFNYSNTFR